MLRFWRALLIFGYSWALATITDPGIDDVDTSNVTSYVCAAFTPAANDLLVFAVATSTSVEPTAAGAMTDDQGGTYTLAAFALRTASASSVYIFVRNQAATAVSTTATFTCTGDAAQGCCIVPLRVAGMTRYGASAIKQTDVTDNGGAGGTPAATFPASALTGNPTIGAVGSSTNPVTVTEPAGWTEAADIGVATPTQGLEVIYRNSGFTGTTITWGSTTAGTFGVVILELDTSAAVVNLVIQNGAHAHTAANVSLTQVHELVVQGASHAHVADAPVLQHILPPSGLPSFKVGVSAVGSTAILGGSDAPAVPTLVISDGVHGHTAESLALTQVHALAVADAAHTHTAQNVALVVDLNIAAGTHAHTAENVNLTQVHVLAVSAGSHAHTAENLALTQTHELAVGNAGHAHTATNIALTQVHELGVQAANHGHVAENLTLTQVHVLTVQNALHDHVGENIVLSTAGVLGIQDGVHGHSAETLVLTQVHDLVVQSATHGHTAANVAITVQSDLVVANAAHGHIADNVVLAQVHALAVQSAAHGHTAENLGLTQESTLVIANGVHVQTATAVFLVVDLAIQNALHAHTADSVALAQVHALLIASGVHAHTADALVLSIGIIGVPVLGAEVVTGSGASDAELIGAGATSSWGSGGSTA